MSGFKEYDNHDALGLAELVRNKEVAPLELVEEAISRIEELNPILNAVIYKAYDRARDAASTSIPKGLFQGVPFLIKDMVTSWKDNPMTWSCPYFKNLVSPADMIMTGRMRKSGLIPLGNTHVPPLGWSLSSESAMYGVTKNPWNLGVSAGGSSGGSGSAVASRMVPIADASDAAGSIRVPASYNGLVGLKPSRGRVTLGPDNCDFFYGGAQVLCVSRTVRDTAAFLDVVAGSLPGEPYSLPLPAELYLDGCQKEPGKLRVAFTTTAPDGFKVSKEVTNAIDITSKLLESQGHHVEEHNLTIDFNQAWEDYCDVVSVQNASIFNAFAPIFGEVGKDDVAPTIWGQIQKGRQITGIKHSDQVENLRRISRQMAADIQDYDALICPVLTHPPRPLGWWDMSEPNIDKYNEKMKPDCLFTVPFNISGMPAISLPVHHSLDNLPVGVQLVANIGEESTLLKLSRQLEQMVGWSERKAEVTY